MGHLRAVGIFAAVISVAIIAIFHTRGLPITAVGPFIIGTCVLIATLPFPAYTRSRRNRVTAACVIYTLGGCIFSLAAVGSNPTMLSLVATIPPLMGLALSVWAYRTRSRQRTIGFSNYYRN
jgi:hypothetical protein